MKNNLFGTDGIRTKVGNYPLNQNISDLAHAIATWIQNKSAKPQKILIAHDTRNSSSWIKSELKSKLLLYPNQIFDANVLPTPIAFHLVEKIKLFDFAIVVTASHNPFFDNGVKIITQHGKLEKSDELEIQNILETKKFAPINFESLGSEQNFESFNEYRNDLNKHLKSNFLLNKKIVLDCANGATQKIASEIFENFGAQVETINNCANGFNINHKCGSTDINHLQKIVLEKRADFGVAFDGDGDRIFLTNSAAQIKDGDDILYLLMQHPDYKHEEHFVGTIMSNEAIANYTKITNKKFIRADVGDKNVINKMTKYNCKLGSEPSGHIMLTDFINCSDGIFAALKTLESALLNNNLDLKTIEKFPSISKNIKVEYKHNLENEPIKSIIQAAKDKIKNGRMVIRYSGTEPVLRILIEEKEIDTAKKIIDDLIHKLSVYLSTPLEKIKNLKISEKQN